MALNNSELTEKMMAQAIDLSRAWKHHYLGLEHIFAAACRVDGNIAESLSRFGITSSDLENGILDFVPIGDPDPLWDGMPETPRYRRLMKSTVFEEAESCRALRLEPKHIVTAILREGRSVPCRYLRLKNVDLLTLRDDILGRRVGSQATPSPLPTAPEASPSYGQQAADPAKGGNNPKGMKMLLQYGRDMVEMARQGKIDPVIGRDDEVRRVLQVLTRKTKSNPVLVGEAGVGKTAVAYGLALRIAAGTVPEALRDKRLIDLSLTSLVAGTGHRGEFEKRLQDIMNEAQSDSSIILFIDEIHQIVGAGDSKGGMDAGNILKPALARGDLRVMGATTIDEYRKYIEADPALERRFQQVMVGEPSEEDAFEILKGIRARYEQHHGVTYPDETLLATVKLSMRFLPDRNLPDKAIDLIDEAAARIKNRPNAPGTPEANMVVTEEVIAEVIADWTGIPVARVSNGEEARLLEMEHLLQGRVIGQDHAVAAVASTIRVVRVGLSSPNRPAGVFMFLGPSGVGKTELAKTLAEFLFGSEHEMVRLDMSEFHDKHSVARLIGAPPGYVGYEGEGQLTKALRTRPFCVLLLDEVEKAHPDIFDIFLQVFDDGRLTDAKGHTVNFTNAIIIMTSNLGARSAYKEAQMRAQMEKEQQEEEELSAAAAGDGPELKSHSAGIIAPHTDTGVVGQMDSLPSAYQNALLEHFRPEFLNRIDEIVVFRTLSRENMRGIVDINLRKSIKRVKENRQVEVDIDPAAVDFILDKGYHPEFGARPLNRAIDTWLTRPFAEYFLRNKIMPGTRVKVECDGDKLTFQSVSKGFKGDTMDGEDNSGSAAVGQPAAMPALGQPPQSGLPYGQPGQLANPYGAPPVQGSSPYGVQPVQGGSPYGAPPVQGGNPYGAQPVQGGIPYGAPPVQGGNPYGAPPVQGGSPYGAPPVQGSSPYGAQPVQGGNPYGAPPVQGGNPYGAQVGQGGNPYGAPPVQGGNPYGAQAGQGGNPYGAPPVPGGNPYGAQPVPGGNPYGAQPVQGGNPYGAQPVQGANPYGAQPSQGAINPFAVQQGAPLNSKGAALEHLPIARKHADENGESSSDSRAAMRESLGRISPNLIPKKEELSRSKEQYNSSQSSEFVPYNRSAPEPIPSAPSHNGGPQEIEPGQWPSRGPSEQRRPEVREQGFGDFDGGNPFGHRPPDNRGGFDPAPFGKN